VIGHAMNGQQLLLLSGDDARDVFVEFLLPLGTDQILTALHREDHLDVDLRIGVGHRFMPLLRSLICFWGAWGYKHDAPTELQFSFEGAVEDGGEQGIQFGGGLGLQALHIFHLLIII
jgi:hypothetical protein